MAPFQPSPDRVLCHCLRVTHGQVQDVVAAGLASTVKEVMAQTGAGGGCTACHCVIKRLLSTQCTEDSSSPTCVIR